MLLPQLVCRIEQELEGHLERFGHLEFVQAQIKRRVTRPTTGVTR